MLALCDMKTLYLRNVPDDVAAALDDLAKQESMSVSALAVRELKAAMAYRANVDLLWTQPDLEVHLDDVVEAVRAGRDR